MILLTRGMPSGITVPAQGITIADPNLPDCPLMYVNEAFCNMTGYTREEIIGRNCRFLQGPDTDASSIARIRTAIKEVHHPLSNPLHHTPPSWRKQINIMGF